MMLSPDTLICKAPPGLSGTLALIPKTAWKLDGVGGVSTGQPGSPPTEHGSTTGRYTCPQAIQSTIGSTMAANRPTRRNLIRTPIKKLLVTTAEELNILTAGRNPRQCARRIPSSYAGSIVPYSWDARLQRQVGWRSESGNALACERWASSGSPPNRDVGNPRLYSIGNAPTNGCGAICPQQLQP